MEIPPQANLRGVSFIGNHSDDAYPGIRARLLQLVKDPGSRDVGPARLAEEREILAEIRGHLEGAPLDSQIRHARTDFAITPMEARWLELHDEALWLDYVIQRYRMQVFPGRQRLGNFPPHLLIEPTPVCNLRCVMCFQADPTFASKPPYVGMMDMGLFHSLVDEAVAEGCHSITLASRGEPTLHPRFGEMVRYLGEKGVLDAKVNTNATRLTERLSHEILSADIATVVFSVDATDRDTYANIRVRGDFDEVFANIKRFEEIRRTHYPNSAVTTRVAGVAVNEDQDPEEMHRFWSDHADQVAIVAAEPRWDTYHNDLMPTSSGCPLFYERVYVWFDGTVNPCDFDYKSLLAVGNATEHSVSSIWRGERLERLRSLHARAQRATLTPCDRCPVQGR